MSIEYIGWAASTMVAVSLSRKTIVSLRIFSICSNVLFISYALFKGDIWSVFILHTILLPVNLFRLRQITNLIRRMKTASANKTSLDVLIPYMKLKKFRKGTVLFKQGDQADKLYYIHAGKIELVELGRFAKATEAIGEIGIFSPFQKRTATARCMSDVEVYVIDDAHIKQIYFQNPEFGYQLVQLIIKRMIGSYHGRQAEAGSYPDPVLPGSITTPQRPVLQEPIATETQEQKPTNPKKPRNKNPKKSQA